MLITVKYFASLREILGRSEDSLEIRNENIAVSELCDKAAGKQKPLLDIVLAATNIKYIEPVTTVKGGDEIAFFSPVTGV